MKPIRKTKDPRAPTLPPIEYDPLAPGLTVLHRAGIAGLLLQIETLRTLNSQNAHNGSVHYQIPECEPIFNGRGIQVTFSEESFYYLMRERYRGLLVKRIVGALNHKLRQAPKKKPKRYLFKRQISKAQFEYLDPRPLLQSFEVFKSHEAWQEHTRDAIWSSYYCIHNNRLMYKLASESERNEKLDKLWSALRSHSEVQLDKPIYPTANARNLKDTGVVELGETALLLHFWPLVAGHFVPVNLKVDKDKKTGWPILKPDWQPPTVVVPDVTDVQSFVEDHKEFLGTLGNPPSERLYEDATKIATPLEAPLAFFAAPRLARGARPKIGTRGAEVYVFKKRKGEKQPVVSLVLNESLEPRVLDEYSRIMQKRILSLPFRAVCVQNILAKPSQSLYQGFEQLVDRYPLELFVATRPKNGNVRQFLPEGALMARSLRAELIQIREKEKKKMTGEERSIPFLIWRITQNYLRWRACTKAVPSIKDDQIKAVLGKLINDRDEKKLASNEREVLKRYNAAMGEVVERAFIDFRGSREPTTFANAFSETLFRAPQFLGPRQAERLQPFYEGTDWESGRRLVLMAISATGANASPTARSQHAYEGEFDAALSTTIGGEND